MSSLPGSIRKRAGWGFEQPFVVAGVPAMAGELELDHL